MLIKCYNFIYQIAKLSENISRHQYSDCKSKSENASVSFLIAPLEEIRRFIVECMCKIGTPEKKAQIFANSLVLADYTGVHSHGMNRLEKYIKDVQDKLCNPAADPKVTTETASTAVVCGQNGLGFVIAHFCMDLAMSKASKTGIGMVVANESNHFGMGSMYTLQAVEKGFIGLSFSNTSPLMVPTNAKNVALGTNPLSLAAPAECGDNLVVDIATTTTSLGAMEIYKRKGKKLPEGWAINDKGLPETDPEKAMKFMKLLPLGGAANHKGMGLALIVEVLSGLLADSKYGPNIRRWGEKPEPANLGHGFIAIDPEKFAPCFESRLGDLLNHIRQMEPVDPKNPVKAPGDNERAHTQKVDKVGGIAYVKNQLDVFDKLSKELSVRPIEYKKKN